MKDGGSLGRTFGDFDDYSAGLYGQLYGGQIGASEAMMRMQMFGLQTGDVGKVTSSDAYQNLLSYRPSQADYSNAVRTAFAANLGTDPSNKQLTQYTTALSTMNPSSPGEAQSQLTSMLVQTPEFQRRYLTPEMSSNQAKYGMAARNRDGELTGGYISGYSKAIAEGRGGVANPMNRQAIDVKNPKDYLVKGKIK